MHLMYFVQYFKPEKASGLNLVDDLLEGFINEGWKVDVYTPMPTRGITDEERKKYSKKKTESLYNGKLTIHRMALYREGKGFIPRALRYIFFSIECFWKGLTEPADVVFTGSGPPTQGLVGTFIRKLTKKKFVYNLQDAFPDSMIAAGMATERSPLVKIGRVMERIIYKNADLIITISDDMSKGIIGKGTNPEKVFVVSNWIDMKTVKPITREKNPLFDELGLSRYKFYIVYAGNIGYVQGIDGIIEAALQLKEWTDIHFVIFGNGSEENTIRDMIKDYGLSNVSMYPLLNAERVSEVYSMGNVSLVTCKPGTGSSGMPSKTWTIMATGTPVLGVFDKPSVFAELLASSKTGWCIEAGKTDELCAMITTLYRNKEQCEHYGLNARKYVEMYLPKNKAVARYIDIIGKCIGNRD